MTESRRGPVVPVTVDWPLTVKTQQEPDGTWVAVLPGYQFHERWAQGATQEQAVNQLVAENTGTKTHE